MNDDQFENTYCDLVVILQYGSERSSYDPIKGMKRNFGLFGYVDDPEISPLGDLSPFGEPSSALHAKKIAVEIGSLPNKELLEFIDSIRVKHMAGKGNPCGLVRIRAGVEAEKFELDGKLLEVPPISATLALDPDSFEIIRDQAVDACSHQRNMRATITLVGNALPISSSIFGLKPNDLDFSTNKIYGVKSFELCTNVAETNSEIF